MQVLDFQYKGERDYVHGTDMYQRIVEFIASVCPLPTVEDFRMTIHEIVHNQCRLESAVWEEGVIRPKNAKVEFTFKAGSQRHIGWLVETSEVVAGCYPYDEDKITGQCRVEGKTAVMEAETPYSAIEVLVAVNKHFHSVLLPGVNGKWYFTRLDLERLLPSARGFCFHLEMLQNLHNRVTKTRMSCEGRPVGHIYFSLVTS